jgi:phosphatidylglycerol:prolipoprotein diacylglycerol transferase
MSLYGALFGGFTALIYLGRHYKVRVGHILDAFVIAFGWSYITGLLGALLDGSYIGIPSNLPWAVRYAGHMGLRHPVQVYEMIYMLLVLVGMQFLSKKAVIRRWPYGVLGLWFFILFTPGEFMLEFFKVTPVYLAHLRVNQWILVALFAETMGAFYVRGGGREAVRPIINRIVGGINGKFSKRTT